MDRGGTRTIAEPGGATGGEEEDQFEVLSFYCCY
jgi:hypothetical protein